MIENNLRNNASYVQEITAIRKMKPLQIKAGASCVL